MSDHISSVVSGLGKSALLPILFTVIILFFTVMSSVYLYHWRKYSMNTRIEHGAKVLYFGVSGFLILGALISLMAL
jgi:hypothetical protein